MRSLLVQVKPSTFSEIVAMIALYRPGPLESGMAEAYARRKHGQERVVYDHPSLEQILEETYGVILYQEQVMQIARDMSGFSMADADMLRKAMGKKIKEVMEKAEIGEVITIKTLISHPMESGQRKDKEGNVIPRKIINKFVATFEGEEVVNVDIDPAVSANPYFQFAMKFPGAGTMKFEWTDDDGSVYATEKKIKVG